MTRALVVALAGASGFISLSYEILWARTFSFAVQGRAYAFAMLLALFLTGIAIGARVAAKMSKRYPPDDERQLQAIAMFIGASAIAGWAVIPIMALYLSLPAALPPFTALYAVAIAAVFLGAQLPLLAHYGIEPDDRAGIWMSYLYGANIVGSVAGSLLTGFVLADIWTLDTIVTVLTCAGLAMSFALYASTRPDGKRFAAVGAACLLAAAAVVVFGPAAYDSVYERLFHASKFEGQEFKQVVENKSGVIAVDQDDQVFGGGVYDGEFNVDVVDDTNGVLRPYSISAFHPDPKRVLMIGLATGSWARVVANHPDVEELIIVEINPGYLEILDRYPGYDDLPEHPKVELIIDDGRRWLNANQEKFDVIVSNTTIHWVASASTLMSIEFMKLLKDHLHPDGIVMLNTTGSKRAVKTTFEVFGSSHLYLRSVIASPSEVEVSPQRLRSTLLSYRVDGARVIDPDKPEHAERLRDIMESLEPSSPLFDTPAELRPVVEDAEPITDDNMGHEWAVTIFGG